MPATNSDEQSTPELGTLIVDVLGNTCQRGGPPWNSIEGKAAPSSRPQKAPPAALRLIRRTIPYLVFDIFGFFYRKTCILVDRKSQQSRQAVFNEAQRRLKQGNSICIFPEGGVPDDENIILDEAQYIKNDTAQVSRLVKRLNADFKLCLSGTPIENNLFELKSLLDFAMPSLLGSQAHFKTYFQTLNLFYFSLYHQILL